MPLSRPYGVTRPVVGQMFHVKHWLWCHWCSGRWACCPAGRAAPWAAARPRAVRAASFARRVVSKPGQAPPPPTAPLPVIQNAQLASESPVIRGYVEPYTFSTQKSRHFPPVSVSRPRAPRPDPRRWQASPCPLRSVAGLCLWAPRPGQQPRNIPVAMRWLSAKRGRGTASVTATVCKKSAAPAGLRTCVKLRRCRNSLSGVRPSPGAWRRRAR